MAKSDPIINSRVYGFLRWHCMARTCHHVHFLHRKPSLHAMFINVFFFIKIITTELFFAQNKKKFMTSTSVSYCHIWQGRTKMFSDYTFWTCIYYGKSIPIVYAYNFIYLCYYCYCIYCPCRLGQYHSTVCLLTINMFIFEHFISGYRMAE